MSSLCELLILLYFDALMTIDSEAMCCAVGLFVAIKFFYLQNESGLLSSDPRINFIMERLPQNQC